MPGILGYARVSTGDQNVAGQRMRLEEAGAIRVFTDVMSGKSMERPGLIDCWAMPARATAIVRLGRSLGELLTTVQMLRKRQIALLSLEEKIDTSSAAGALIFHVFGAIAHFERRHAVSVAGACLLVIGMTTAATAQQTVPARAVIRTQDDLPRHRYSTRST